MLEGKITLVTGISTGIGLATAKRFLKEGAKVVGIGKKTQKVEELGDGFLFLECDVTQENQIASAAKIVESSYGKLDTLVTICDEVYKGSVLEVDAQKIDAATAHIFKAPVLLGKHFCELLHKSENPCILHDVPVGALMMEKDFLEASVNTAVVNYVRQSTPYLRPIRNNAVMFGLIQGHNLTTEKEAFYSQEKEMILIPAKRFGTPEDVAGLNTFLASDRARYINSSALQVDGGFYTMHARSMGSAI